MKKRNLLTGFLAVSMASILSACSPLTPSSSTPSSSSVSSDLVSNETPSLSETLGSSENISSSESISSIDSVSSESTSSNDPVSNIVEISNVEEFLAFRLISDETKAALDYKLTADIDLSGVELPSSKIKLTGTFDGNGHKISNATLVGASSKSGILVAQVIGGCVKNVSFFNCSISSTNESPAIVAGEINGDSSVINVECNNCVVVTTSNYGGIIYARSEGTPGNVLLDQITIKNNSYVSCGQYGGLVSGDNVSNVTLTNSHISGLLKKSSNNYGLLLGRTRSGGIVYKVENVIADVVYDGTIGSSTGFICQGKEACTVNVKNMLIIDSNTSLAGAKGSVTAENVYYLDSTSTKPSGTGITEIAAANVTSDWIKTTLLSDFDSYWVVEDETHIKLKDASPNIVGENDVLLSIEVISTNAKTRFKKGEEFISDGLVVTGVYDSGVSVTLSSDKYQIDSTAYNKDAKGEYTISVKAKDSNAIATYKVNVVEQTGFNINDEFVKRLYVIGEDFSIDNLAAYSVWSDELVEKMDTVDLTIDASGYDKNKAGVYDVIVKLEGFTSLTITVEVTDVVAPTPVDNVVNINVDKELDGVNGTLVDDVPTFKTLTDALNFYKACDYQSTVKKVINLKNGEYREKVTIDMDNIILKGESREGTKIVYDAVESTVDPVTNKQYVLNCATVHVNAQGFEAHTISIINDFDYMNNQYNPEYADVKESSPQGLALTLNGDRFIIDDCHLYGNQDTLYLKAGRAYFKGGIIEGNIDFIFGEAKGIGFFDEVNINAIPKAPSADKMSNNGYVTAMKGDTGNKPEFGIVFNGCDFTSDERVPAGSMSLGRPWGKKATVAYINCSFSDAYSTLGYDGKTKSRWFDMSGNKPSDADFVEYGSTGKGAITEAVDGGRILTEAEAAKYTISNVFASTNGDFTFNSAFDPNNTSEPVVDNNTYYYFNGSSSSTGKSYTYNLSLQGAEGLVDNWNGLKIDGTVGKVVARESDTQINAGGKIVFTVPANSTITVETYPGYHDYTLNGNATYKDQYTVYYAEETEVTFLATGTVYLYSIIIKPNQTAPAASTLTEIKVTNKPTEDLQVGAELDLSKLVVQAYYSDGTIKNLVKDTDYTLDVSAVNKDEAGTYEVKVTYQGKEEKFNVKYVSVVDNVIRTTTTYSFKDDTQNASDNYIVYGNETISNGFKLGKIEFANVSNNNVADNGDWLKFQVGAEIKFSVSGNCTLSLDFYNGTINVEVTVGGNVVTANADGTYNLTKGNVVIKSLSNDHSEYIGKMVITFAE